MEQIITRQEAKQQGLRHYFTGKECKRGHVCKRYTQSTLCVECQAEHAKNRYHVVQKHDPQYVENNRARSRQQYKEVGTKWHHENKERAHALNKAWREEHKEEFKEYCTQWRRDNLDKLNKNMAAYRAAKIQATPPWLTEDQKIDIEWIYHIASWMRKETNEDIEVDHIVPLRGPDVSGLHVPWNLQFLLQSDNGSKYNKLEQI